MTKKPNPPSNQLDLALAPFAGSVNPYGEAPPLDSSGIPTGHEELWASSPSRPAPPPQPLPKWTTRPGGNPYWFAAQDDGDDSPPAGREARWAAAPSAQPLPREQAHPREGISKAEYRRQCGRILKQYIPAPQGHRMPDNFRDFIERNANRSALGRMAIVNGLRKFDLNSLGNVRGHFHRAPVDLTVGKLLAIEKEADGEE